MLQHPSQLSPPLSPFFKRAIQPRTMSSCVQKKSPSNTATEIIFNDKVKTDVETEKDLKGNLGNTKANTFLFC